MYVSQFTFDFAPEHFEPINRLAAEMVRTLRKMPGCRQMVVVRSAPSQLTSYVTYETRIHAEAAVSHIAPYFERLAPYLERLPRRQLNPAIIYEQFEPLPGIG